MSLPRVFLLVFIVALMVRLFGLGQVLTADEERWIIRAGDFYRSLETGDLHYTFQGTHPGVTVMSLAGLGIKTQELLTGERFHNEENVGKFFLAGKVPVTAATALLIGLIAVLTACLVGRVTGVLSGLLLAVDPFLLGYSQLVHLDALLALFMLASLLSFLWFLETRLRRAFLLSAFLGGLALLTKLPAVFLLPVIGALALLWGGSWRGWHTARAALRALTLWILLASLTVVALWPSMWRQFFWNLDYVKRDVTTVTTRPHFTESELQSKAPIFYPRALLAHTQPLVALLAAAALVAVAQRREPRARRLVVLLLCVSVGFVILLSLVAKRADRYVLPAAVPLVMLAGMSLGALWRSPALFQAGKVLTGVALVGVAVLDLAVAPYALAVRNPFVPWRAPSQEGWGEGLDKAAAILNEHPLAPELEVATWYPNVFRHFFQGKALSLSSLDDPRVDYVVLYRNMRGRGVDDPATTVLEEYARRSPEHVVRVLGEPTAWVYRTDSVDLYPSHVGELRAGMEVGQLVTAERAGLSGVRLVFATFSSRQNTVDVILHVREGLQAATDLRTVTVSAADLEDGAWHTFTFDPLRDSAGKSYYVFLTSPEGRAGNAVTVRFQEKDIHAGQMNLLRTPPPRGTARSSGLRASDLAYRLVYGSE